MDKAFNKVNLYILLGLLLSKNLLAQTDSFRYELIESLSKNINKHYVSAGLAKQMNDSIKYKFGTGGYDSSLNMDEFTFEISKDLRRISRDNHITVTPTHYDITESSEGSFQKSNELTAKQKRRYFKKNERPVDRFNKELQEKTKDDMFTYGDIAILPGNIGYIEIFDFNSSSYFKKENKNRISIASVFRYLCNTKSIIIDLRENQGGATRQAARFCSYFAKQSNAYFITTERFFRYDSAGTEKEISFTNKHYTDPEITNSLTQKKCYILVSDRTFSAAELVAYKIKQFDSTVQIIGEQTRGGGNGYTETQIEKYYTAIIPSEISFDEDNSNFNIEGKGIIPDISSDADSAFDIAYRFAYDRSLDTAGQEIKFYNKEKGLEGRADGEKYYPDYIGNYRKIYVNMEKGKLFMTYDTFRKSILAMTAPDTFKTKDFDLIHFTRNSNGLVVLVELKHKDGYLEKFKKQ